MYDARINVSVTRQARHFVENLAIRQNSSVAEIVRLAPRQYLNAQEDVISSRTRMDRRVLGRLENLEHRVTEQQAHAHTLLLAAIILLRMKKGDQGAQVLEQIDQLAAHASAEIRAVLEVRSR